MVRLFANWLLVVALGTASSIALASQPPAPSGREISSNQQSHAAAGDNSRSNEQRGTERSPLVVKVQSSPIAEKEASDLAKDADEEAANNRRLFVVTCVLAVAALLQWGVLIWQSVLLNISARATQKAAITAERALTELEIPYVSAAVPSVQAREDQVADGGRIVRVIRFEHIRVSFLNYGRTPAHLTFLEYALEPAQRGGIPTPIDPARVRGRELPVGTVTDRDKPYSEDDNLFLRFNAQTQIALGNGEQSLWLRGFVRYEDIFHQRHISGFCMVYDLVGGSFVRRGDHRYNYSRAEQPNDIPPQQIV